MQHLDHGHFLSTTMQAVPQYATPQEQPKRNFNWQTHILYTTAMCHGAAKHAACKRMHTRKTPSICTSFPHTSSVHILGIPVQPLDRLSIEQRYILSYCPNVAVPVCTLMLGESRWGSNVCRCSPTAMNLIAVPNLTDPLMVIHVNQRPLLLNVN
jgi:hypothetical protein